MVFPRVNGKVCKYHEIEGILLTVGASPKVIPEQKNGFFEGHGVTEFDHDAFIGRAAVHDGKNAIALTNAF